jgi:hypothetical protein
MAVTTTEYATRGVARHRRDHAVSDRVRRGLANLEGALKDAEDAATAARTLAARRLGA